MNSNTVQRLSQIGSTTGACQPILFGGGGGMPPFHFLSVKPPCALGPFGQGEGRPWHHHSPFGSRRGGAARCTFVLTGFLISVQGWRGRLPARAGGAGVASPHPTAFDNEFVCGSVPPSGEGYLQACRARAGGVTGWGAILSAPIALALCLRSTAIPAFPAEPTRSAQHRRGSVRCHGTGPAVPSVQPNSSAAS